MSKKSTDYPKKVSFLAKKDRNAKKVTGDLPKNVNVIDNGMNYTDTIKGSIRAEKRWR